VAGPVLDERDEVVGRCGAQLRVDLMNDRDHLADHVDVLQLVLAADVIGFSALPFGESEDKPAAVILDIEPIADVGPVAVDREFLPVKNFADHQRNQLLGELIGPVVVRAVGSDDVQPVGVMIGPGKAIRCPPSTRNTDCSVHTASSP